MNEEEMTGFGLAPAMEEGSWWIGVGYLPLIEEFKVCYMNEHIIEYGKDYEFKHNVCGHGLSGHYLLMHREAARFAKCPVIGFSKGKDQVTLIYTFENDHGDKEIYSNTTKLEYLTEEEEEDE